MIFHFDLETQSQVDLKKVGLRNYASHPSTRVVCMAYQIDDGPVGLWHDEGGLYLNPPTVWYDALAYEMNFAAHNIMFDMTIMSLTIKAPIPPKSQWIDTATLCATNNLPRSLKHAVDALDLAEQKDAKGHRVMLQVSKPKKDGTFIDAPDKLQTVYEYCKQDVRAEAQLTTLPGIRPEEKALEILTHEINERGFHVDMKGVDDIQALLEWKKQKYKEEIEAMGFEVIDITSNRRFVELAKKFGVHLKNVQKGTLNDLRKVLPANKAEFHRILQIRLDLAKTPLKKYDVLKLRTHEGRIKDGLVFCGATATGRFSGAGFQPQNLPRGSFPVNEEMFKTIAQGPEFSEMIYGSAFELAESALRGVLTASPGNRLLVVDYAQIEARVLAWLAGQDDVVEQFAEGQDVYSIMASKIYGKEVEEIVKEERTLGKVAVLGCGYGVGGAKFTDVCANFGVETTETEAKTTVDVYRKANVDIVKFWDNAEKAFVGATAHQEVKAKKVDNVVFHSDGKRVGIELPSGRILKYQGVQTQPKLMYRGVGISGAAWDKYMWGGVIVENITQAVARDIMAHAMLNLDKAGYKIVLTVHDEVIVDATPDQSLQEMTDIMVDLPEWAKGCPITAEGFESFRYKK